MRTVITDRPNNHFETGSLVYIRALCADELRDLLESEELDMIAHPENLFAVHNAKGDRLAIVEGRESAFEAARAYKLEPMSRH